MRLGVTFEELVADLRSEVGRSSDLNHGIGDESRLKRALNKAYQSLYDEYDWPHLRRTFTRIGMAAGQRMYDFPTGLDFTRIEIVRSWWNGIPNNLEKGIGTAEFATFDSQADDRSDPPLRWDVRYHDTPSDATMFEVWPVPNSASAAIEFVGVFNISKLVDDADVCLLDADAIIALAAIDVAAKEDVDAAVASAARRIGQIRKRFPDTGKTRVGLGHESSNAIPIGRAVVRVN